MIVDRPDLTTGQLDRTRRLMNEAVPDATLHEARRPGPTLDLPDPDDHHVVDTAIAADADCIVTANLKDFPTSELAPFDIAAISPDALVVELIDRDQESVRRVIEQQAADLRHPPMTLDELLDGFVEVGLHLSVAKLRTSAN